MEIAHVKQEIVEHPKSTALYSVAEPSKPLDVIDLDSTDSDSDNSSSSDDDDATGGAGKRSRASNGDGEGGARKRKRLDELGVILPVGFLDPLPPKAAAAGGEIGREWRREGRRGAAVQAVLEGRGLILDFFGSKCEEGAWIMSGFILGSYIQMQPVINGFLAVCNGATFVNIDMIKNEKDGNKMLLIEDNGGGMDPDKMRQCMSLGPTQSIGLLSYTFLRSTGKEDIVVPMLDYGRSAQDWKKITRSSAGDWNRNVETIVQWSPFSSEADLLRQFNRMKDHGTLVVIYNLWEDDQGLLELDFDTDQHDIQIRGVNRDDKNIQMAQQYPNSRHYLTYRHSLRSYASILYLRIPPGFRVILRGKDVEHHNIVNDMMMTQQVTYRPNSAAEGMSKDMVAVVTMGFVKDAKSHIDVQGFNVYHKNRLIKPFWRLWNPAGSGGRGVIGVLEANFVEPAHDKQGFERTIVLSRLEARLIQMQKTYWGMHCHKIGYAVARSKKDLDEGDTSPDYLPHTPSRPKKKSAASGGKVPTGAYKYLPHKNQKLGRESDGHPNSVNRTHGNGHIYSKGESGKKASSNSEKGLSYSEPSSPSAENLSGNDLPTRRPERQANGHSRKVLSAKNSYRKDTSHANELEIKEAVEDSSSGGTAARITTTFQSKGNGVVENQSSPLDGGSHALDWLRKENCELKERLKRKEEDILGALLHDLQSERDRCKSLEAQLQVAAEKIEGLNKEQETLIDIFSEERARRDVEEENLRKKLKAEKELRDVEEENLRKKLKDATNTIQGLVEKVRLLEKMKSPACKPDR
ncbi:hypothetical protein RJ639_000261 [Escallonia herrerae]|uniref:Morc S5 domain-containing protein n=1 Tax=Escallonia herrerae TaxID=1293975 RepID=A0AA88X9P7_9ASTE|nr:hypothetical protein RJ639_000261 [Escallonia herrerae]